MPTTNEYLCEVQYRAPDRLAARARLHTKYGRGDWFDWLAEQLALQAGMTVADVGCGSAAFWAAAPSTVPDDLHLRLYDLSPGMVEPSRSVLAGSKRWSDVTVGVADAVRLPVADDSVDAVMAVHVLHHLNDPAAAATEFARILAPEGHVAVVLNAPDDMTELSALVDRAHGRSGGKALQTLTSEAAFDLLRGVFRHVDVRRYDDELRVTDSSDLLDYLMSLPLSEAAGAPERLAAEIERTFMAHAGIFQITRAAEMLICRK